MVDLHDCDMHVADHGPDLWADVDADLRIVHDEMGGQRLHIGPRILPRPTGPGCGNPAGLSHLVAEGTAADRAEAMRRDGTASAVLQPGFVGLSIPALDDVRLRRALLRRYNALVAAEAASSPSDTRWVALVALEDLDEAHAEVERWRSDPRLVGIVARPTGRLPDGPGWSDRPVRDLLAVLAAERLTLFLHGGTGCYQWSPLADRFSRYDLTHALGHMGEHLVALTELTCGDELPDGLRVVLLEAGTAWIPAVLDRLESHARRLTGTSGPWERFRRHVALVPDITEEHVLAACERIGGDNLLYGSDHPHWDAVDAPAFLAALAPVTDVGTLAAATAHFVPRCAAAEVDA